MGAQVTKKAYVWGCGCPENLLASTRVHKYLVKNGWQIASKPEEADLLLYNSCALTDANESDALARIKDLQARAKVGSRLLVWGCLPKVRSESLQEIYEGPYEIAYLEDGGRLGEADLPYHIDDQIHAEFPISGITVNEIYPTVAADIVSPNDKRWTRLKRLFWPGFYNAKDQLNLYRPGDTSIFYLNISRGCVDHCTYCAERLAQGTVKSKPLETVLSEFKDGLAAGYKEFSVMGTDVGCYGRDRGNNLFELLEKLTDEKGDYKIGIRNTNPAFMKDLIDGLEPILKKGKIWFIGLPAESGSNRILKLMGRRYTVEEYREYCQRLKAAWPDLVIRNQMLVGFPTETERDFAASLKLVREPEIDYTEVYAFSGRPGTAACDLRGELPSLVINSRYYRMLVPVWWRHRHRNDKPATPRLGPSPSWTVSHSGT